VVRKLLNRLIGRTDSSIGAVNAYLEGNASSDEIELVKKMMRTNAALEKDLSTQQALRSVLGRIDSVEAPRSFAISPEMVAAAERSESGISRFIDLFAPQRKLALAPAVIAGIAALSVALLTLGDITGVVDQSGSDQAGSFSTNADNDSAAVGASIASSSIMEDSADASMAPAATTEMAAALAAKSAGDAAESGDAGTAALSIDAAAAPELAAAGDSMLAPEPENIGADSIERAPPPSDFDDSISEDNQLAADSSNALELSPEMPAAQEIVPAPLTPNDGISLPLRQLQFALAALALAAIGAWAGLRRARGE
jgi:hypothetical protein